MTHWIIYDIKIYFTITIEYWFMDLCLGTRYYNIIILFIRVVYCTYMYARSCNDLVLTPNVLLRTKEIALHRFNIFYEFEHIYIRIIRASVDYDWPHTKPTYISFDFKLCKNIIFFFRDYKKFDTCCVIFYRHCSIVIIVTIIMIDKILTAAMPHKLIKKKLF